MLSERLRDLEAAGLVRRTVIPTSPPTVEYRLTEHGRRLGPVMEAMRAYAEERASDEPGDQDGASGEPASEEPASEEPVGR